MPEPANMPSLIVSNCPKLQRDGPTVCKKLVKPNKHMNYAEMSANKNQTPQRGLQQNEINAPENNSKSVANHKQNLITPMATNNVRRVLALATSVWQNSEFETTSVWLWQHIIRLALATYVLQNSEFETAR